MPVQPVEGVPRWFTVLAHRYFRWRHCRNGHASAPICTACGYTPGWTVVIVGRESGHRTQPLSFLKFITYEEAAAWCVRLNDAHLRADGPNLTYYEPVLRR